MDQRLNKKQITQSILNIRDKVRVSKYKHIFEKGYTPNWTTEIFTIFRVKNTFPVIYKLKDYDIILIKLKSFGQIDKYCENIHYMFIIIL